MDVEPSDLKDVGLALGVLVCLYGVYNFSLTEAAFLAVNRMRLRALAEQGDRRADVLHRFLENPENFLGVLIVGINGCVIIGATFFTLLMLHRGAAYVHWALLGLSAVILVFGEIVPKSRAYQDPEGTALRQVGFVRWALRLLRPVARLFTALALGLLRGLERETDRTAGAITERYIRTMIEVGDEEGVLEEEEREIIENIFEMGETVVREIMVPRVRMVCVPETATLQEAMEVILAEGYTRIPVCGETRDEIRGLIYAKEVLKKRLAGGPDSPVTEIMHEPYFVPETKRIDDLLRELKARKISLAIVIDEYGGTAGLVTVEDILEEIVGEIQDEHDEASEPLIQVQADGSVMAEARVEIEDLAEYLGIDLPEGDFNTLGGFVLHQAGHVPEPGEVLYYPHGQGVLAMTVRAADGQRVEKVEIKRLEGLDHLESGAGGADREAKGSD